MRVLHFCPLPLYSGLEQYALALVRKQIELGIHAEMVVVRGSMLEQECAKVSVPSVIVDFDWRNSVWGAAQAYALLLADRPDLNIIHLHTSQDIDRILIARLLNGKKSRNVKVIQQNHIWMSHSKKDPIHWLTYRSLDQIWCSSEPARQAVLKYLPVRDEQVKIIKYGRDIAAIESSFSTREAARDKLGLPLDALVLGTIARIEAAKGIRELVDGSKDVLVENPNLHLLIIGGATQSDPSAFTYEAHIKEMIESYPKELRTRIHMTGQLPEATRYLKAFDLYAQVSYRETFSLALLDAQLAGLAVLGTNSGGTPEVVREGQTGWLCEPGNSTSLKASLNRALAEREAWFVFGERARKRVKSEFDFTTVVRDIISRYEQMES